jgi:DNA-binding transcriptional MerR regulator
MYIGEFATLAKVTPKTVRFYESIGLLPEPLRNGRYRVYDETYVETVKQIKMAQDLGFKLAEIKSFAKDTNIERGLPAAVIMSAIHSKRQQIKVEIEKLQLADLQLIQLQEELKNSKCNLDSDL